MTVDRRSRAGLWPRIGRQNSRRFSLAYKANRHRWPWPEQGIKSIGRHPMGELSHGHVRQSLKGEKCGEFTSSVER